jgi:hypothetical protein
MADPQECHPLFPLDEDADPETENPNVQYISVCRWETGNKVTAPRMYRANELTTLEQLFADYGGGKYELLGRGPDNSRIIAKRSYSLPGPSKPMFAEQQASAAPNAPAFDVATLVQALQQTQQPAGGFNLQTIMGLLTVLAPVVQAHLQNQAAAQQASLAQQQQLFATVLTASQQSADKLVTVMGQLYQQKPAGPAGASGDSEFRRGMEYMQEFLQGQLEGKSEGEGEPSMSDLLGLAKAYMESQGRAPVPAVGEGGKPS